MTNKLYDILQNDKADVVVGSRYVRGIQVINWPLSRILLSYFASLYVRLITQIPIKDTTAGFVGYKRSDSNYHTRKHSIFWLCFSD